MNRLHAHLLAAVIAVLAVAAGPHEAAAQSAQLVRDINTAVVNAPQSDPRRLAVAQGRLFYSAETHDGVEPWVSDGTEAGTTLLRDIVPGIGGWSQPFGFVDFGGAVYFAAQGAGGTARQIWSTDGTAAGTVRAIDRAWSSGPNAFAASGSRLFFTAGTDATGVELWVTDGTDAGTALVKDINPGPNQSFIAGMTAIGGRIVFSADDGVHGRELWASDGTTGGTVMLMDISASGHGLPSSFVSLGGRLCFGATSDALGRELWCTDGTSAGTALVTDVASGIESGVGDLVSIGSRLFFGGRVTGGEMVLWTSDGTAAGTVRVADVAVGPSSSSAWMTAVGNVVFFVGSDSASGAEIWRSDGTTAGTALVADIEPGSTGCQAQLLTAAGGRLYFTAVRSDLGREVWVTDGTAAGTRPVADIAAGTASSTEQALISSQSIVALGDAVYFSANDGQGRELWRAAPAGAAMVRPRGPWARSGRPGAGRAVGDRIAFQAFDGTVHQLWSSDGSATGTARLETCAQPCPQNTGVGLGPVIDGALYFSAYDVAHGLELWRTDGTQAGTRLFSDLVPGPASSSPGQPVAAGSHLFFSVQDSIYGGLWSLDVETENAARVASSEWEGISTRPLAAALGDILFTSTRTGPFETTLHRSDGTAAGTTPLRRLDQSMLAGGFHTASGITFFVAGGAEGRELWRTDGTIEGTRLVRDICPGACSGLGSDVDQLPFAGVMDGRLFLMAWDGTSGYEPWVSDGTEAGTRMLRDVFPGAASSWPMPFQPMAGIVYFAATSDAHGRELWRSDGTPEGTFLVKDAASGPDWGLPGHERTFLDAGGRLLYTGCLPATGCELWETDGSAQGTRLRQEFWPGPSGGYAGAVGTAGGFAYFSAASPATGFELWADAVGPRVSVGDARVVEGDVAGAALGFDVRIEGSAEKPLLVTYATAAGSATAGVDFTPVSGAVTFAPGGPALHTVLVPVAGDLAQETDETLSLRLTGGTAAIVGDPGAGVIEDDDAPTVSAEGGTATEGNAGTSPLTVTARLQTKDGPATLLPFAVHWQTRSGTATSGSDFTAAEGLVTFPAGTASGATQPVVVSVTGDLLDETNEAFQVVLRPASTASAATADARAEIVDDDGTSGLLRELTHGGRAGSTASAAGVLDWFVVHEPPGARSYEAVFENVSGDLVPLRARYLPVSSSVHSMTSVPAGTGSVQVLRWTAFGIEPDPGAKVHVDADACAPLCGPDDGYTVRLYDTTLSVPRILNAGANRTALVLFNPGDRFVTATVRCWSASGLLLARPDIHLPPKGSVVQDTCANGATLTITHDGGYGGLVGKAVTFDTAAGFAFDTPVTSRPR